MNLKTFSHLQLPTDTSSARHPQSGKLVIQTSLLAAHLLLSGGTDFWLLSFGLTWHLPYIYIYNVLMFLTYDLPVCRENKLQYKFLIVDDAPYIVMCRKLNHRESYIVRSMALGGFLDRYTRPKGTSYVEESSFISSKEHQEWTNKFSLFENLINLYENYWLILQTKSFN